MENDSDFARLPGHLIRRVHQRAVASFMAHTQGHDITPLQFALLAGLAQSPEDVDQITLAQRAALDTSTAASALDRMEAKGWIERRLDPADRRRRVLHITAAGQMQLRRVRKFVVRAQDEIVAPLSEKERDTLLTLLKKLASGG